MGGTRAVRGAAPRARLILLGVSRGTGSGRTRRMDVDRPDREDMAPGDEVPPEQPPAGENECPDCDGSGRRDGEQCPTCGGSGVVTEGVGGG